MNLVIDANILFSLVISKSKVEDVFVHQDIILYSPEFIKVEIEKHIKIILNKTHRSEIELSEILDILNRRIRLVPYADFAEFYEEAQILSPDKNDAAYLALALKLKCAIWSNDKKLKEQNVIKVYSSEELIAIFL